MVAVTSSPAIPSHTSAEPSAEVPAVTTATSQRVPQASDARISARERAGSGRGRRRGQAGLWS